MTIVYCVAAAIAEITGCFMFWNYLRLGRSLYWLLPGTLSLVVFAALLTRVDSDFAGRAYAAYGVGAAGYCVIHRERVFALRPEQAIIEQWVFHAE